MPAARMRSGFPIALDVDSGVTLTDFRLLCPMCPASTPLGFGAPPANLGRTHAADRRRSSPRHAPQRPAPPPYAGAIAAARPCYSPRVVGADEVTDRQRESIGPLTFEAGHHTVYQHAHFEFGLERVSRQFVWSFLHAHPFYNSEQSSQRFVRLDQVAAHVPDGLAGAAREVFEAAVLAAW